MVKNCDALTNAWVDVAKSLAWNWWFSTCSWKSAGFVSWISCPFAWHFVSFTEWPICSCKMAWWKTLQKHSPVMLGCMHPCACDSNRPNFNTWSPKSIYTYSIYIYDYICIFRCIYICTNIIPSIYFKQTNIYIYIYAAYSLFVFAIVGVFMLS